MLRKHSTRLVVLLIVLAVAAGVVFFIGVMGMPFAARAIREAMRREQANRQLREISLALRNYAQNYPNAPTALPSRSVGPEAKLPFDTYSGYFVSNKFEPNAAESFVVIADQEQFDKVFGVAAVMGDNSHRLPKDAFKSLMLVAAIKRGSAVVEFKVEGVAVKDGVVELRYTASSKRSDSASFACPLIVSIPKGNYSAVTFVENKKPVKTVEMSERNGMKSASGQPTG
jgi:hypothetical protein